jgi:hypothetical protein
VDKERRRREKRERKRRTAARAAGGPEGRTLEINPSTGGPLLAPNHPSARPCADCLRGGHRLELVAHAGSIVGMAMPLRGRAPPPTTAVGDGVGRPPKEKKAGPKDKERKLRRASLEDPGLAPSTASPLCPLPGVPGRPVAVLKPLVGSKKKKRRPKPAADGEPPQL